MSTESEPHGMNERQSFISATLAELNRRKVLRTVGAYAVGVFVLLQLMDAAVEPLRLPDWVPTIVVLVVILGFPLVFLLAMTTWALFQQFWDFVESLRSHRE